MSNSNTIRSDSAGKTYIRGRDDIERLVNPDIISETKLSNAKRPTTISKHKFKLVTVRKLTKYTVESINADLAKAQKNIAAAALRQGMPVPYPSPAPTASTLNQYYGVYIDEDLLGTNVPVFSFYSSSNKIRCFITANGKEKEDWSIHICYELEKTTNVDKTYRIKWRLFTLDNKLDLPAPISYVLDSNSLPECFEHNFDLDSINYLGGGCWSSIAIDPSDRIPVYAIAPNDGRYPKVGQPFRAYGEGRVMSIVAYSCTPTYNMTWCRGELEQNKRIRNATVYFDAGEYNNSRVITMTRNHNYQLDLVERPAMVDSLRDISKVIKQEFVEGKATYVGNTNRTVCSTFQCPDFNTDSARLSIASYLCTSNITRPNIESTVYNLDANKASFQPIAFLPILCASPNMSFYLRINMGEGKGEIKHGYELKTTAGARSYSYFEPYKYWWGYGKVVSVSPYGDTNRYHRAKSTGERSVTGSMFDYGELIQDPVWANRVLTTWNAPNNPPSGFFGIDEGTLKYIVTYLNPPLTGHDGVYYYHINPPRIGADSGSSDRYLDGSAAGGANTGTFVGGTAGRDVSAVDQQNELLFAYSQMLGAIGGGGLTSLNIGVVTVAGNDKESIVVRDPNPTQKAAMQSQPETFPSGFWDSDKFDLSYDNENHGTFTAYGEDGQQIASNSY